MAVFSALLALVAFVAGAVYLYTKHRFTYWAKRGVKHDKPSFPFGNLAEIFAMKTPFYSYINELYNKYPSEPVVGFYGFGKPILVIRDVDIIKDVLIKDFNAFVNRSFRPDKHGDPLGYELMFGKSDDEWRNLRQRLAFAFTTGRMRKMYPLVKIVGEDVNTLCTDASQKGEEEIDIRNYCNRYAIDVITSCAFGSKGGAVKTPDQSIMFRVLNDIFEFNFKEGVASNLMFFAPAVYGFLSRLGLGFKIFRKEVEDDVYKVVDVAFKERHQSAERRGDIFDEIAWSEAPEFQGVQKRTGAAFQMLIAGSETSSSTIVFTLYELARHPEVQRKLQKEIRETLQKHNGEVSYDVLSQMEYLDQVVKETLRLYPVLPFLDRIAQKDYQIAGTDITIEKGSVIFIPMWALQKDPNFFPEPESFKPERFSKETGQSFPEMAYIPFGAGPRFCIGKRFGIMSVKSFLLNFLKDFDVNLSDLARKPLEWNKKSFTLFLENGMTLNVTPSKVEA